jgi:hypothetical protein
MTGWTRNKKMENQPIEDKECMADILWSWESVLKFMLLSGWIASMLCFVIYFESKNISEFIHYLVR